MSEQLLDRAGRRRSPATLPGFHPGHAPGNKDLRYPADPPRSKRSSPSCGPPATERTAAVYADSSWSCVEPGCLSRRHSLSARAISIIVAAHCEFGAARAGAVANRHGLLGLGTA